MIFVTGDTHNDIDIHKLSRQNFNYEGLTKDDYIIICGDFGFIWHGNRKDDWWLNWLEDLPCSVLWADGNHENFDAIEQYPVEEWHGGKVHKIREHVIHLMRGEIYDISGKKFFVCGGAESHDKCCRKEGVSGWPQERPTYEECEHALENLEKHNWKVDYVITHSAPDNIQYRINPNFSHDMATNFLFTVDKQLEFTHWYFGHYHIDREIDDKHTALYQDVIKLDI